MDLGSKHFVLFLLLASLGSCQLRNPPQVKDGKLDLRGWDWNEKGVVKLRGEWEFYWNELLGSQELAPGTSPPQYIPVPSVWNDYVYDGQELAGSGYATYRLTVLTDPGADKALRLMSAASALRVLVNGE